LQLDFGEHRFELFTFDHRDVVGRRQIGDQHVGEPFGERVEGLFGAAIGKVADDVSNHRRLTHHLKNALSSTSSLS
jgi:hypothetical protein